MNTDQDTASYIERAARAAIACLDAAGIGAGDISMLLNTGVYRDSNISEPAVAALVQKRAGIGLTYRRRQSPTMAFDVMNGPCGFLNAVQIGACFLVRPSSRRCLVVAGDTHPSLTRDRPTPDFPYIGTGAAAILERADDDSGFGPVHSAAGAMSVTGSGGYVDTAVMGAAGRSQVTISVDDGAEWDVLGAACQAARNCLRKNALAPENTVLVTSEPFPDFAERIRSGLGLQGQVCLPDTSGNPHTSGLIFAYHAGLRRGFPDDCRHLLFVSAGNGPTAASAAYRIR
ncbi:hypothetical protein [Nocardia arthritidis]|uniref:Beta-ketoacyl-[acyl-carrier-protein] synthase III N-terminal domain-containing protein n=1 Tax=Nocardia arthritidis TaxID=228602 RepID=A0A6G9YEF1_9NOCA|nr:hypothetical protein [Nocardia arthritidis]QIS11568.1 hypothetical protein F5544_18470 [Nocardia arthritidis]